MPPAAFPELAVCLHGSVGLYRENRWLSLVRITGVGFDERMAWLDVSMIPSHGLRSDHGADWRVSSIWEYLDVAPTHWRQVYVGVVIEFAPDLVEAVVRFAASLRPGFTPEHYDRLQEFMREFRKKAEAGSNG